MKQNANMSQEMELYAQGMAQKDIAGMLGVSEQTVSVWKVSCRGTALDWDNRKRQANERKQAFPSWIEEKIDHTMKEIDNAIREGIPEEDLLKRLDAVQRGLVLSLKPGGRLVFIGTILLSEDEPWSLWTRKIYRAVKPDGNGSEISLWEERFPLEFLQEQKRTMGLSAFNAEYQNMPTDDDTALFTEAMIRDGGLEANAAMVLFIDPSVDGIKANDYKAGVLAAKNKEEFIIVDAAMVQGSNKNSSKRSAACTVNIRTIF